VHLIERVLILKRFNTLLWGWVIGVLAVPLSLFAADPSSLSGNESGIVFVASGDIGKYKVYLKSNDQIIGNLTWKNTNFVIKAYITKPGRYTVSSDIYSKVFSFNAFPGKYTIIGVAKRDAAKPNVNLLGLSENVSPQNLGYNISKAIPPQKSVEAEAFGFKSAKRLGADKKHFVFEVVPDRRKPPVPDGD
jgi:hypothetical protein